MKEIDDTPVNESESEYEDLSRDDWHRLVSQLVQRISELDERVGELEVSRAVMRQKLEEQDEEWY